MDGSRVLVLKKQPKIILTKSFPVFGQLNVGDSGQLSIEGIIVAEREEFQEDGVDRLIKTVEVDKAEIVTTKNARNII